MAITIPLPLPEPFSKFTIETEQNLFNTITWQDVAFFIITMGIAYVLARIVGLTIKKRFTHRMKREQLIFFTRLVQAGIFLVALAIAAPNFLDISLIIVLLAFVAVAAVLALSSQKVLSNWLAGAALHYERPFGLGDFIELEGGVSGIVESIKMFCTVLRTPNGVYVRVPNDSLYLVQLKNYTAYVARRYEYTIGIRYQDNPADAVRIISELVKNYPFTLQTPAPDVFVSGIDPSCVTLKIRVWFPSAWVNTQDDVSLRTEILSSVKNGLEAAGMEIPYPQQTIWIGSSPWDSEGRNPGDRGPKNPLS